MEDKAKSVFTEGGSAVDGNVTTGGDFVGRDKIEQHLHLHKNQVSQAKVVLDNFTVKRPFPGSHHLKCYFDVFVENDGNTDIYALKLFLKVYPPHRGLVIKDNYLIKSLFSAGNIYELRAWFKSD